MAPFRLELVSYSSQEPIAQQARNNPWEIQAYICNLGAHWFTVRRFANQYFNLNSMYYVPEWISHELLEKNLKRIEDNGYSVLIVHGKLDHCIADDQLTFNPIHLDEYFALTKDLPRLIMDGKVMDDADVVLTDGKFGIKIPRKLFYEYEKNPDDPEIQKKIDALLPKGVRLASPPKDTKKSKSPRQRSTLSLLVASAPDGEFDQMMTTGCNCPECHQRLGQHPIPSRTATCACPRCQQRRVQRPKLSNAAEGEFRGDTDPNRSTRPLPGATMVARQVTQVTQVLIDQPGPNIPNRSGQPQNEPMSLLIIERRRTMVSSHEDELLSSTDESNLPMDENDDPILREVLARSLLDQGHMNETQKSDILDQMEKKYQERLDELYATDLYYREATAQYREERSRLMSALTMNSPSTTNSEPLRALTPSSPSTMTNTSSPVTSEPLSTSTNKPVISLSAPSTPVLPSVDKPVTPPISAPLPKATTIDPVESTVTNSTLPKTSNIEPKTTMDPPSPKLTPQNSVESPTIEGKPLLTFQ